MQNRVEDFLNFLFKMLKYSLITIPLFIISITGFHCIQYFNFVLRNKEIRSYEYRNISNIDEKDSLLTKLVSNYLKDDKITETEYENIFKYVSKRSVVNNYFKEEKNEIKRK